ncbi:carbonic anhydrase, partial [Mycobacterium tuberculosis]
MPVTEPLLARHRAYSAEVRAPGGLPAKGTQKVAVVACMDSRLDVFAVLGLTPGDAHVIRNAGGIVT